MFSLLIEVYLKCFFVELYMKRAIHKKNVYSTSQWFTAIRSSQWSPSSEPWDSSNSSLDTQRGLYVTNLQLYLPTFRYSMLSFIKYSLVHVLRKQWTKSNPTRRNWLSSLWSNSVGTVYIFVQIFDEFLLAIFYTLLLSSLAISSFISFHKTLKISMSDYNWVMIIMERHKF